MDLSSSLAVYLLRIYGKLLTLILASKGFDSYMHSLVAVVDTSLLVSDALIWTASFKSVVRTDLPLLIDWF